jgi:hypothetical protein
VALKKEEWLVVYFTGCHCQEDVWHECAASGPHTAVWIPDPTLSPLMYPVATLSLPLVLASMLSVTASVLTATIDTNIAITVTATIVLICIDKILNKHDLKTSEKEM